MKSVAGLKVHTTKMHKYKTHTNDSDSEEMMEVAFSEEDDKNDVKIQMG